MPEPRVSVVIPLHNAEQWISETLMSVFASKGVTSNDVEVIVVDDGSQDDGARLAKQILADGPFKSRLLQHTEAKGAAAARNTGWQAARAPWIQFLDADDLLASHKIRLHLDAALANPDASVLYSRWAYLSMQGTTWQITGDNNPRLGIDPSSDLLCSNVFLQIGSVLLSVKALHDSSGFDQTLTPVEDVAFLQCVAMQGGQFVDVHTDQPTLLYRQVPGSLSRRDSCQFALGCLAKAETADDHFRVSGEMTKERRERLTEAFFFCARSLASHDATAFERAVKRIETLQGSALPSGPAALRHLSRVVGYRRAEQTAVRFRRLKTIIVGDRHA